MAIDYEGGVIVGRSYNVLNEHFNKLGEKCEGQGHYFDIHDWLGHEDQKELTYFSEWFDCGVDGMIIGYRITDINESELEQHIKDVKEAFKKIQRKVWRGSIFNGFTRY